MFCRVNCNKNLYLLKFCTILIIPLRIADLMFLVFIGFAAFYDCSIARTKFVKLSAFDVCSFDQTNSVRLKTFEDVL